MEWFTCRVQFVNDGDPLANSNTSFPEPTRSPFHCFNANIPLTIQLPAVHRLLGAHVLPPSFSRVDLYFYFETDQISEPSIQWIFRYRSENILPIHIHPNLTVSLRLGSMRSCLDVNRRDSRTCDTCGRKMHRGRPLAQCATKDPVQDVYIPPLPTLLFLFSSFLSFSPIFSINASREKEIMSSNKKHIRSRASHCDWVGFFSVKNYLSLSFKNSRIELI